MIAISIIIVLYKSEQVIFQCLDSILRHIDIDSNWIEVILVDNYELSDFEKSLNSYKRTNNSISIKYVHNPQNGGFGQGNNIGVAHSTGNILFFLNPDTILTSRFSFRKLLSKMDQNQNMIVGFRLIDTNGNENNSYGVFPEYSLLTFIYNLIRKWAFFLPNKIRVLSKILWPWGAAFAINRKVFVSAGRFDEKIFLCNEEPDLLKRIPNREVHFINMDIVHLDGHTTSSSTTRYRAYLTSALYYISKYKLNKIFFFESIITREKLKILLFNSEIAKEKIKILREFK